MVIIISNAEDRSTDEVISWLKYDGQEVLRINSSDRIMIHHISFEPETEIIFSVNGGKEISSLQISAYWYRRGSKKELFAQQDIRLSSPELQSLIMNYLKDANLVLADFFFYILENTASRIGAIDKAINNKLVHLKIAKELNIRIPSTLITGSRGRLKTFGEGKSIISKSVSNGFFYEEDHPEGNSRDTFGLYANEIKEADTLPESFFPSLVQETIYKKFELRIFYLKGKFYSMAIFSQRNKKTAVDFRKYDDTHPNYTVPFELPNFIRRKLQRLMNAICLDTGSIDMIYGNDSNYYFLEVNPIGQFGMVSYPCNYYLERVIAKTLSH
ncbi:MAG: peptide maturase, grasp-with-spasm system [Bacteroidetes bacterium]|nr:peptide maturase, grasp-with-spasm system [Bacteroidota bacterium]